MSILPPLPPLSHPTASWRKNCCLTYLTPTEHMTSRILSASGTMSVRSWLTRAGPAILTASAILHDCVVIPKNPVSAATHRTCRRRRRRGSSARWAGMQTRSSGCGMPSRLTAFRRAYGRTLEARILQDADRLDALGMVGVARCFHVGGQLDRLLYDPFDPAALHRTPDDTRYTIDHFRTKLFKIADDFQTATSARLAKSDAIGCNDFSTSSSKRFLRQLSSRALDSEPASAAARRC